MGESCIFAATGCPVAGAVPPAIAASSLPRAEGPSSSSPSTNPANFDANAASTSPASAVVRVFFAPSARGAHAVASSREARLADLGRATGLSQDG